MTGHHPQQRLWLALRFPDFCLNALCLSAAESREIIAEKQKVVYATLQAKDSGVVLGMNVSSAQLLTGREALSRNLQLEQQALQKLAYSLYQFTPYIEEYICAHEYGLLLEVSQCLCLFNGIEKLCEQVFRCLEPSGFSFDFGIAHTAKGAWLLSYHHYAVDAADRRDIFVHRLNKIPLRYLKQYTKQVEQLAKSGFHCLGDVARQIEATAIGSLNQRFEQGFIDTICEIFDIGKNFFQASLFKKPRKIYSPQEGFCATLDFDYPIKKLDHLQPALKSLLEQMENYFVKRQCEFTKITWCFYNIFSHKVAIDIQCAYPQVSSSMFYELSCLKLDAQGLPFEIDSLVLQCDNYTIIHNRNRSFAFSAGEDKQSSEESFALIAAKLSMFLGDKSIFKISYQDSHVPEISNCEVGVEQQVNQNLPLLHRQALRPCWIFKVPYKISIKKQGLYWRGYISLVSKAERIDTLWWQEGLRRDYFLAQRQDYLYLWVFLDLKTTHWYVHGIFA